MADFKSYMEKLSPELKEKYGDVKNATEFVMAELYDDEELMDEELNNVAGGRVPLALMASSSARFRCACGSDAIMAALPSHFKLLVCPTCYENGTKVPLCPTCSSKMILDSAAAKLSCPKCSA